MSGEILNFKAIARQIADLFYKGEQNNLTSVFLKGEGTGSYYSVVDRGPVTVSRKAEFYLLPIEETQDGKIYVFSTYIFFSGLILLVHKDQVQILGPN